ncbi:MAG: cytochrome b/b6 domain-containing protein [Methyloligellaceae bacterium]
MSVLSRASEAGRSARPAFVRVWDPFVRVFHWALVACFAAAWITADEWDRAHEIAGYAIIALVGLRCVWGLVGPRYARFSDFVAAPSAVIAYLRDVLALRARRYLGHNPAGGAMIMALLVSLAAVCATGVMLTMDAFWAEEWVEELHEAAANLTLVLVAMHVLGVAASSLLHGENLVKAMITGRKRAE